MSTARSRPRLADLARELRVLSWGEVINMAVQLGMDYDELMKIEAGQLLRVLKMWLNTKPNATWMKVVNALKKINRNVLAERLEKEYCNTSAQDADVAESAANTTAGDDVVRSKPSTPVLTPGDETEVLQELQPAQNKAYALGMKLLIEAELADTHFMEPQDRLQHVIAKFLKQKEPRPTWRAIVDVLKDPLVGHTELAGKLEAAHCQTSTQEPLLVPIQNQATTQTKQSLPTPEDVTLKEKFTMLKNRFNQVKKAFIKALVDKNVTISSIVDALTQLPVDEVGSHQLLDDDYLKDLSQSSDHSELIGKLSFIMDHHLLEYLSESLEVNVDMSKYKDELRNFKEHTPLVLFCAIQKRKIRLFPIFQEIVVRLCAENYDNMCLQYVEQFRQEFSSHYKLHDCAIILAYAGDKHESSKTEGIYLIWFFPNCITAILQDKKNIPISILGMYHVDKLMVKGLCIYRGKYSAQSITPTDSPQSSMVFKDSGPTASEASPSNGPLHPLFESNSSSQATLESAGASGPTASEASPSHGPPLLESNSSGQATLESAGASGPTASEASPSNGPPLLESNSSGQANSESAGAPGPISSEASPSHGPPLLESNSSGQANSESAGASGPTASEASPSNGPPLESQLEDTVTMDPQFQPHLTSCCGKNLSQEAAVKIMKEGGACPHCKVSKCTVLDMKSLSVQCFNEKSGCKWQGKLSQLSLHLSSCPSRKVSRDNPGTECQEGSKIIEPISSMLAVECHQKKTAPNEMKSGSATTDGRYAYFTQTGSTSVYRYELSTDKWKDLPQFPHRNSGLVIITSELTAVGGWVGTRGTRKQVTLKQNKWSEKYPQMKSGCSYTAVVSTSDGRHVIVIGWCNGDRTAKVELYDVKLQHWYKLTNLESKNVVSRLSATICGDKLNVIGNDANGYSCSLQALPSSDTLSWNPLPTLPVTESTAATLCGQLVIIGGRRYGSAVNSIHQLVEGKWVEIGSMVCERRQCLVASPSPDKILIVGGYGSEDTVEECVASNS